MIYNALLFVPLLGVMVETIYTSKVTVLSNRYFLLISLFFIGVGGLTKTNGLDINAYTAIFESPITANDIWEFGQFEPFFLLLCNCFPSYESFIFVFMVINLIFISRTIKRYSPYTCLSLFVYITGYYLLGPMGQIRQAIAISIMIYAWRYFNEKRILFWVAIASLFHYSAIICILLYFISDKLKSVKFYVLIVAISVIVYIPIQGIMMNLLANVMGNSLGVAGAKVALYLSTESTQISILYLMYKLLILSLLLWKRNALLSIRIFPKLLNIYVVSILMWLFLSFSGSLGGRLSLYFSMTEILLLPYIFWAFRNAQLRFIVYPIFITLCIYQYYSFLYEYAFIFLPYKSIFS